MSDRRENCFTMLGTDFMVIEEADADIAREELRDAENLLVQLDQCLDDGNVLAAQALVLQVRKACNFALQMIDDEAKPLEILPPDVPRLRPV